MAPSDACQFGSLCHSVFSFLQTFIVNKKVYQHKNFKEHGKQNLKTRNANDVGSNHISTQTSVRVINKFFNCSNVIICNNVANLDDVSLRITDQTSVKPITTLS